MEERKHLHQQFMPTLLAAILTAGVAGGALAADPPVKVTMSVTGDPAPGATVAAKATMTITDGSTLQSIKWSQVGGVAATLRGGSGRPIGAPEALAGSSMTTFEDNHRKKLVKYENDSERRVVWPFLFK